MLTGLIRAFFVGSQIMMGAVSVAHAAEAVDQLGVPGPLTFQNKSYSLAWSSKPSGNYIKQEYVPKGESVQTYETMILVEAVTGSVTPSDAAGAQINMLDQRKSFDHVANYAVFINDKTGEVVLDFVVSDHQVNPVVVEWNAYRYIPLKGGKGTALYGISRRAYGEADTMAMLKGLKEIRDDNLNPFVASAAPAISVKN